MSADDRPLAMTTAQRAMANELPADGGAAAVKLLLGAIPLVGISVFLEASRAGGHSLVWERLCLTLAAVIGLSVAALSCRGTTGRTLEVRGWITIAFGAWLGAEVMRDLDLSGLVGSLPSDLGLVIVVVGATGAYRAALRGRLSRGAELSIYLDASIVVAAVAATVLAVVGGRAVEDPAQLSLLLRALIFLGVLASTAMLDLALLAPRTVKGPYSILLGVACLGIGYIGRAGLTDASGAWPFAALIAAGVLVAAFGTATWTDAADENPTYARLAQQARDLIPLAAVAVVPLILLPAQTVTGGLPFRMLINGSIGFIVVGAVVRQRLLLRDRDRVLDGLREALGAVERRARQLGGVEAAGRQLARSGPTPNALDEVAVILGEQFGYEHVAIVLGEGATMKVAGSRGGRPLVPALDGARGIVGRVMRSRTAELVTDVTQDPDYVLGDPAVHGEICVPLLEGDRLLGILDVQSSSPSPLDETDLAAVLAVGDRLAGAIALGFQRQQLVDEKDFISAILDAVGAIVIVVGADGKLARYNDAASVISGYSSAEIDAHGSLDFLVPHEERSEVQRAISRLQSGELLRQRENEWVRKDGSRRHIAWSNTVVVDDDGVVRYTIATGIDITERKQLEDELAHKALHDALTGLPNRRLLLDRLEHALESRRGAETSLLFLDLDDFKTVNDRLGHDVGDQVLKVVAERLIEAVRPGDTVARLSGDEFAVVLEDATAANAPDLVAQRILVATRRPIHVRKHQLTLSVSIGTATAGDSSASAGDLLRDADFAMYAAKQAGRGQWRRYAIADRAAADDDARLAADLPGAVARGELRVHYQPLVDLETGAIQGMEALVRWQHPERGLLGPIRFIPIAERTGSIVEIGEWVLNRACSALKAWQADAPNLTMAVNLSGRQLESSRLVGQVRHAIRKNGLLPSTLVLEVTETVLLAERSAISKLGALKALGVRLAIDDFGTGYSSISYLRRFPVDILKIDREFVDGSASPEGLKLLSGIAQLGRLVGLDLVAEGIERPDQVRHIVAAGCQVGQGYLYARPVDGETMTSLLRRGRLGPLRALRLAAG
ncbi:MAG TPA: EAL domain-containing protein [Patescibacteria group bacterium]|nr:EAL domain-containing protein [Patescibacteria group bacterium]